MGKRALLITPNIYGEQEGYTVIYFQSGGDIDIMGKLLGNQRPSNILKIIKDKMINNYTDGYIRNDVTFHNSDDDIKIEDDIEVVYYYVIPGTSKFGCNDPCKDEEGKVIVYERVKNKINIGELIYFKNKYRLKEVPANYDLNWIYHRMESHLYPKMCKFEILPNGNLMIIVNDKEEYKDFFDKHEGYFAISELLDEIGLLGNGWYDAKDSIALYDGDVIALDVTSSDEGDIVWYDDSKAWTYGDYMVVNPWEVLLKEGKVEFQVIPNEPCGVYCGSCHAFIESDGTYDQDNADPVKLHCKNCEEIGYDEPEYNPVKQFVMYDHARNCYYAYHLNKKVVKKP